MKRILYALVFLLTATALKQDVPPRLRLFLLVGQSNMAGRGTPDTQDQQTNKSIWMLTK